jgi:thioredoxin reductase (NADPH)
VSPPRPTVHVVGHRLEPEHHRVRDFLTRAAQPHEFYEAGSPQAEAVLAKAGARDAELPVVVDGDMVHPGTSVQQLAEAWNVYARPQKSHYDLMVVGAGPAGLAAAVYGASDGLSTAVAEEDLPGGQASHTSMIENFFGFVEGIGGAELARLAGRQAERFGAELLIMNGIVGGHFEPGKPALGQLSSGDEVTADIVLVCCGMVWRRLELDGIDELLDHGVYYGAGRSEAIQCAGEDVMVVGAGNSAGQAVMNLASAGARVHMIVRGDSLSKSMSAYLVDRVEKNPNIQVRLRTRPTELHAAAGRLREVSVESADGATDRIAVTSLFICIGGTPRTQWTEGSGVRTDDAGYILTGPDLLENGRRPEDWPLDRDPLALETSVPGLFAAGDVRHGSTKRVAGAVGEGAMAVTLAYRRLDELHREA